MNLGVALPYIKCLNEETVQIGTLQAPQAIKTEGMRKFQMLFVRISCYPKSMLFDADLEIF